MSQIEAVAASRSIEPVMAGLVNDPSHIRGFKLSLSLSSRMLKQKTTRTGTLAAMHPIGQISSVGQPVSIDDSSLARTSRDQHDES